MSACGPLLSIDIGGTKVAWALAHPDGDRVRLSAHGTMPTRASEGGPALARRVAELAREQAAAHPELSGVAIAAAGVVDPATGRIVSATDTLPGWGGTELGALVADACGLPVSVLNDVHAHGTGEALAGAGVGHGTVLVMAVGTGIGGAVVQDGHVATGAHHMAGHLGHVHHEFARGIACSCGRTGHIEAICSGSGLAAWYHHRGRGLDGHRPAADGAEVARLAAFDSPDGDPLARAVITESGQALGEVLGSLANTLDPSIILLTGSVTALGEPWWERVRAGYAATAMDGVAATSLRPGSLGGDAPLLGAALHHLNRTTSRSSS